MLEWLQDIDWSEVAIVGFFVLLVVALGVLVADMFVTEPYTVQGQVIGSPTQRAADWLSAVCTMGEFGTIRQPLTRPVGCLLRVQIAS